MRLLIGCFVLIGLSSCSVTLDEVRSKWKVGPEWRTSSNGTNAERWTSQTGLEAKLSNGHKAGLTFRRRDLSHADGFSAVDNGLWFEYSFPIWRAKNHDSNDQLVKRIEQLEAQMARLPQADAAGTSVAIHKKRDQVLGAPSFAQRRVGD